MRKILLSLVLFFAAISSAIAQKLTVESFKFAGSDLTAQTQPRKDLNNHNCALIKVGLGLQGVQFEGNIMGNVENKTGEYWVYMPQGNRMLKVKHANYAPVMVNFADYGVEKLESNRTYELIISFQQYINVPNVASQSVVPQQSIDSQPIPQQVSESSSNTTYSIPVKDGLNIEMVRVEAGTFMMGATPEMKYPYENEKPVHKVTLTNNFYIGKCEVTQALWQAVMDNNPSMNKGDNLPVELVSWDDCQEFINKLNNMTGREFRLPTEAEWEYAARGGKKSKGYQYSGSDDVYDVAWYETNVKEKSHTVGTKAPNELGIYDMAGNVAEWCQDKFGNYKNSPQTNPTGTQKGKNMVTRGGSWFDIPRYCRSSCRYSYPPNEGRSYVGLRLVLSE